MEIYLDQFLLSFLDIAFINIPSWRVCECCVKMLLVTYLQDAFEGPKPLTTFRSFENPNRRESVQVPTRSKSVLSAFFAKQKTPKLKAGTFLWIHPELISLLFKTSNNGPLYSLAVSYSFLNCDLYSVQASLKCIFLACYAQKKKKKKKKLHYFCSWSFDVSPKFPR